LIIVFSLLYCKSLLNFSQEKRRASGEIIMGILAMDEG
jgi:hypothetical protein